MTTTTRSHPVFIRGLKAKERGNPTRFLNTLPPTPDGYEKVYMPYGPINEQRLGANGGRGFYFVPHGNKA